MNLVNKYTPIILFIAAILPLGCASQLNQYLSSTWQFNLSAFLLSLVLFLMLCSFLLGEKLYLYRELFISIALFFFFMHLGWLASVLLGLTDNSHGLHYYLSISLSLAVVAFLNGSFLEQDNIFKFIYVYSISLILICAIGLLDLSHALNPWFHDVSFSDGGRFVGLSKNPNQLALYIVATPFLLLKIFSRNKNNFIGITSFFCFFILLLIGYATRSDALYLSWLISFPFIIIIKVRNTIKYYFSVLVISSIFIIISNYEILYVIAENVFYSEQGQGNVRLLHWYYGLQAWLASPWVGLGPGAFSGYLGPFEAREAHNLIIDLLCNAGIFGVLFILYPMLMAAVRLYCSGHYYEFSSFVAFFIYNLFHVGYRHPFWWVYLLILFSLAEGYRRVNDPTLTARASSNCNGKQTCAGY